MRIKGGEEVGTEEQPFVDWVEQTLGLNTDQVREVFEITQGEMEDREEEHQKMLVEIKREREAREQNPPLEGEIIGVGEGYKPLKEGEAIDEDFDAWIPKGLRRFRYIVQKKQIGSGGMGGIYKAWDQKTEKLVAIKAVRVPMERDFRTRFYNEARAMANVDLDPHVVKVFGFVEQSSLGPVLVMEYLSEEE